VRPKSFHSTRCIEKTRNEENGAPELRQAGHLAALRGNHRP
jgi:hypothetical protein